jgi:hypothetical protein
MSSRPAESRTTEAGMVTRATAIVRTKSSESSWPAGAAPLARGVPSPRTSRVIGPD